MMIGVFTALDVFVFYVFFEAILIPIYFMIGRYGTGQRAYAAVKFLIYSLVGGLVMLAALGGLWAISTAAGGATFDIRALTQLNISDTAQAWMFLGFFIAFAIKAPLVPVHTWLPDAAGSARPTTAVLLIGVLDKIGTYGMLRLCLPLFPDAAQRFAPVIIGLSVLSILYGALLAIGQTDIRRLFAYVSISHFGFITLGIFVFTSQGMTGSTFYMLGHGLSTALLFFVAGYLMNRRGSAQIADYGGVNQVAPVLAGLFLFAGLTALALPGLSTFISEFLVLVGTFTVYPWVAVVATLGIVLAALYVLWLYQRTMTGPVADSVAGISDVNVREILAVAPLIIIVIVLGLYPKPALDAINPTVADLQQQIGVSDPEPTVPIIVRGNL
jgi:NADH-quinone oxidoreductase subunit M